MIGWSWLLNFNHFPFCAAICFLSHKPFKLDEQSMLGGALLEKQGWTCTHGCISVGWPVKETYLPQLCVDTGCSLEDLLRAMDGNNQGTLYCLYDLIRMLFFFLQFSLFLLFLLFTPVFVFTSHSLQKKLLWQSAVNTANIRIWITLFLLTDISLFILMY